MGAWSIAPPLLAIGLAITTRQVHLSLFAGVAFGATLLLDGNPIAGVGDALERCVLVLGDPSNAKVVLFTALIGATLALTRKSGGVDGFVRWTTERGLVDSQRRARLLSWTLGVSIFVESSITALVNGAVCQPLFDRLGLSRAKLAYLCDATSAPICLLIPLNAWGAYVSQLLVAEHVANPVGTLLASVSYAFYPLFAVALALFVAISGFDFGAMRAAETRIQEEAPIPRTELEHRMRWPAARGRARDFIVPIAVMVLAMPAGLWITGDGSIVDGSGSTAVLWAVLASTATAALMARASRQASIDEIMETTFDGVGALIPLAALMVLAFAIGGICRDLGTGSFVATWASDAIPGSLIPATIFLLGAFTAFSTGTSWGTFALIIPVAIPLAAPNAATAGADVALCVGAALSGGVFGDHCSPISDTTIIASTAAGCDHVEHVTTQLPYALAAGGAATLAYALAGALSG